jgi:hypothetical protein
MFGTVMKLIANPNMHVPNTGILLKKGETSESVIATAKELSRPATVVTPTSSSVVVGPSGPVSPTAQQGATGEQKVRIGGTEEKSSQTEKEKKEKEKKENKKP